MIRRATPLSHAVAGLGVLVATGLAGFGIIGARDEALLRPEHFDAKQITVIPDGDDGVRVREVVDIDFGVFERRGYQRTIPSDFGTATDVTAFSPDANDDLDIVDYQTSVRIRIGDPNIVFNGQHRYELEYTLPEAQLASGMLALDIIGTDETFTADRFEVVMRGFDLSDVRCDTGNPRDFGGCNFTETAGGDYVTVIEPLEPGEGITVGGTITGTTEGASFTSAPALPDRNPSGFRPLGFVVAVLGVVAAAAVFLVSRRYGSNEVSGAGGAADAAYGVLPAPHLGDHVADVPTYRVPDSRLAELATIEFVPPRGIEPWQAAVLLSERVDTDSVSAWFSEMIARGAIEVDGEETLRRGDNDARLSAVDRAHLDRLFPNGTTVELGTYDSGFSSAWSAIQREQSQFIADAGWWTRGAPGTSILRWTSVSRLFIPFLVVVLIGASGADSVGPRGVTSVSHPMAAVLFSLLVVVGFAFVAYRSLLPSRSATGSALTLRSESFRRFLASSEGRHVDWAWENGVLREYSAWAVALGAADAWKRAVESSNVAQPERFISGPMLVHSSASSFRSAHTAPSSSGGSGGGGGGVGGGGGGGSSGSW